jgi:protein-disulfide isomerase
MLNKIFNGLLIFALLILNGCGGNQFLNRETPPVGTKVVVVEFSDFNCPACRTASELSKKLKDIPNLYFEFRHLPLPIKGHDSSKIAANAFECGRVQNFGDKMEDALFENQGNLNEKLFLEIPEIYNFGGEFNFEEFEKCVVEGEFENLVTKDLNFARSQNLNATPTFFVNGVKTTQGDLLKKIAAEFEKLK